MGKKKRFMEKIDIILKRALTVYNNLNSEKYNRKCNIEELSKLEHEIQMRLRKEPIILESIALHSSAKNKVSQKKLAYCFSNFPMKEYLSEGNSYISAFDMIFLISEFVRCAQRFPNQKILGVYEENIFGPNVIHRRIMNNHSEDMFVRDNMGHSYYWNMYLPVVSDGVDWDEQQPEENLKPLRFLVDHRLFEINGISEIGNINITRYGGVQWKRDEFKVYFGSNLVNIIESIKFLPEGL